MIKLLRENEQSIKKEKRDVYDFMLLSARG
jgi:hypothetical protein